MRGNGRQPPVNVLRVSLHPDGLAPGIVNLASWRAHGFARLRRQIELTADPVLEGLLAELEGYPGGSGEPAHDRAIAGVVVPLLLRTELGPLSLFSTTTTFGTPVDVTLDELAIESFFPVDADTADLLRRVAEQ